MKLCQIILKVIGIDIDYIHAREGNNRKAGWFWAIVWLKNPYGDF